MKRNKSVYRYFFILFFLPLTSFSQNQGITFGVGYERLFENVDSKDYIFSLQGGYIHGLGNRICLGGTFHYALAGSEYGYDNYRNSPLSQNLSADYVVGRSTYWAVAFDSKYFLREFDETPAGFYIGSHYKYSKVGVDAIFSQFYNQYGNQINYGNSLVTDKTYSQDITVHTLGLKFGVQAGAYFDLFACIDFNFSAKKDPAEFTNISLLHSPIVSSQTFGFGVLWGLNW